MVAPAFAGVAAEVGGVVADAVTAVAVGAAVDAVGAVGVGIAAAVTAVTVGIAAAVTAVAVGIAAAVTPVAAGVTAAGAATVAVGCVTLVAGADVGPLATGEPVGPGANRAPRPANAATVTTGSNPASGSAHHQRDSALPRTDRIACARRGRGGVYGPGTQRRTYFADDVPSLAYSTPDVFR